MTPAEAAAAADFGTPSARKTGRTKARPYVPVLLFSEGRLRQQQLLGLAYPTREEAVQRAVEHVAREREVLERKLAQPNYRALRRFYGVTS